MKDHSLSSLLVKMYISKRDAVLYLCSERFRFSFEERTLGDCCIFLIYLVIATCKHKVPNKITTSVVILQIDSEK